MKLTKSKLKQIIKEEIANIVNENDWRQAFYGDEGPPSPKEIELQGNAEADGRADFEENLTPDPFWGNWEGGKYLKYYQMGWDNAAEQAEYDRGNEPT